MRPIVYESQHIHLPVELLQMVSIANEKKIYGISIYLPECGVNSSHLHSINS